MTEGKHEFDFDKFEDALKNAGEEEGQETGAVPLIINMDMLAKRVLWDMVPCNMAAAVAHRLNLHPASEDVEDMEHRQSHERMFRLEAVAPIIMAISQHAAISTVAAQEVANPDLSLTEEQRDDAIARMNAVIFQASATAIAELIDFGLLHTPHMVIMDEDGESEEYEGQ